MNTTSQCNVETSISKLQATPLKKRIVRIENSHTDKIAKSDMTKDIVADQSITNNTRETNIQFSPTKEKKTNRKNLRAEAIPNTSIHTDICGNKEIKHNDSIQNNLKPNLVQSNTESANISPMKVNNSTPKKAGNLLHDSDNPNCNNKIDISSVSNRSKLCLRELDDLLKTPPSKKTEKMLESDNTVPTNKNLEKINKNNDYKQFCDTMQSELCNSENFNAFEDIDFLHDDLLNTAINDIDNTKASDILSSIPDISTLQYIDENLADLEEDPPTDPLFISDHEEKVDTAFIDSNSKPRVLRRSGRIRKKPPINYSDDVKRHKLNTEEKSILEEVENIKKEELPLSIIQQLSSLCIELVHKVPPQHKIEITGAHATTNAEKSLFKKYGPLRKGSYSPKEDEIITRNWNTFCKIHDWDSKTIEPFFNWRHNGKYYIRHLKERQKFVQFLANGLPWRTLYSVYSRFKVLYRNKSIRTTRYTSKEDKKILMYIRNKYLDRRVTKYTELAKLLGRTSHSIFRRYNYLKKTRNKSVEKLKWTLPLIKKFIKTLLSVTKSDDLEELKYVTLPMPIWQKMEEKLNIDGKVLKIFWQHQLHLQLFSTSPIYLDNIKIQLIEYMYKKGISNTREIIWPNVAQYFDGATAIFLCRIFFHLVQEYYIDVKNFANTVEYLYHKKIPEIRDAPTDKFLPRIIYKNGKIDVLNLEDDTTDTNTVDYGADCDTDDD